LLTISSSQVKDYCSGRIVAQYDTSIIKDYRTGRMLYKIDGFLSGREIASLLAILFAV
jgi:hypothetical protein